MSEKSDYVSFPNYLEVSRSLINTVYAQLLLIEAEGKTKDQYYYCLWELIQKARNPTTFKISAKGASELFERGLLDKNGILDHLTQSIVLYLVVGYMGTLRVITFDELQALLS